MSTFNTPPLPDILQEDEDKESVPIVVPVEVRGIVRTDEMPTITYYRNVIILTGAATQKVLQENPRRKRAIMWAMSLGAGAEALCVGENEGKATQFSGAMLWIGTGLLRYEFTDKGPLYMRGVVINDTTGTFTGFSPSTDDIVYSVAEELWAE